MGKIGYENSVENIQENSGNILKGIQQENIDKILNRAPQENADSVAGALKAPGYVGGFFGTGSVGQSEYEASNYVGGFVQAPQTKDYEYDDVDAQETVGTNLPVKSGFWSKVKSFLFEKEVAIEITPKEQKILTEIHDFLHQDVSLKGFLIFSQINLVIS